MNQLEKYYPQVLSIVRIVAALLFMEHGLMKILHFPIAQPGVTGPLPPLLMAAGLIEIVGGALLALGLFTRVVAFICSGEMALAYFMVHAKMGFYPMNNHGEIAVLYCFVFLYLAAAGGGAWSFDRLRHRG